MKVRLVDRFQHHAERFLHNSVTNAGNPESTNFDSSTRFLFPNRHPTHWQRGKRACLQVLAELLEVLFQLLLKDLHGDAICPRSHTPAVLSDMGMGSTEPLLIHHQFVQVKALAFLILGCPLTQLALQFPDIHRTSPMVAFS